MENDKSGDEKADVRTLPGGLPMAYQRRDFM